MSVSDYDSFINIEKGNPFSITPPDWPEIRLHLLVSDVARIGVADVDDFAKIDATVHHGL